MPFTFSHPAIILPARLLPEKYYSFTGLIVGSMAPDFEYFIRMKGLSLYSHTLPGIFWFDLPLGFFLAFVYHNLVRDALIANLPLPLKARILHYCRFNWTSYVKKNWPVVLVSLIIGSASHLFWDSFTHYDGFFVSHFHIFRHHISMFGFSFPFYYLGQDLSSVVGLIIIFYYIYKLPKDEHVKPSFDLNYWFSILIISVIVIILKIYVGIYEKSFHQAIVVIIASGLIALIVTSWMFRSKFASVSKS
jgi:hypothetical protein